MPPVDSATRNNAPNVLISEVRSAIQTIKMVKQLMKMASLETYSS